MKGDLQEPHQPERSPAPPARSRAPSVSPQQRLCVGIVASQLITPVRLQLLFAPRQQRRSVHLQRCLHYLNYRGLGRHATCYFPPDSGAHATGSAEIVSRPETSVCARCRFFSTQSHYGGHKQESKKINASGPEMRRQGTRSFSPAASPALRVSAGVPQGHTGGRTTPRARTHGRTHTCGRLRVHNSCLRL